LNDNSTAATVAINISTFEDAENLLWSPTEIFVHINADLYVANYDDHRIQRFKFNQTNASTVEE
jgi:hypothetical protein